MTIREDLLRSIEQERARQHGLPGSEYDLRNTPNDWIAIASRYLAESGRRGANIPVADEYRDSLIKTAAIILAALEHIPRMSQSGHLRDQSSD